MKQIKQKLEGGALDGALCTLYGAQGLTQQRQRYLSLLDSFESTFPHADEPELFSSPGRTEIGGNHTDHQHGCVVAASVDLDLAAAAAKNSSGEIRILSEGYPLTTISLFDLAVRPEEKNTTAALIRGVAAGMQQRGYAIGGFDAVIVSDVLEGSGLSSSAAFEVMVGTVLNHLYNGGSIDPVVVAQVGQYAENVYFGKPCGLLDQMACSVGGYVAMDFYDPSRPMVEKINFDLASTGYTMCIVDTKGSHADLTEEYACVPAEMKAVAACFGEEVLREVPAQDFYNRMGELRQKVSDRALLRACHFYDENLRAQEMAQALRERCFDRFLDLSNRSGRSSYLYLQNVYACTDPLHQSVSLALCVAERLLGGRGSCRVHGGGFAGTIQVFIPNDRVEQFCKGMEQVIGERTCHLLSIRPIGGVKLEEDAPWQN